MSSSVQMRLRHCDLFSASRGSSASLLSSHRPVARRRHHPAAAYGNGSDSKSVDEDTIWSQMAFPSYLQSRETHKKEVCREFDKAVTAAERKQSMNSMDEDAEEQEAESVWFTIRREAERDAAAEPLLSSFLYATILAHDSFERALAFVLSNRLANSVMLPTQLFETFYEVLISDPDVRQGALADVESCRERDPACTSYSQALLYYKGYHAIQTHRIAHALWCRGQKVMAVALQSRMSEVLAVDIHPAARFGHGILLDHGTGVVIGETAVIGNNVSLLQNVTLGGTGKDHGDRHPKISDNVLIGASATVLGNIRVGEGAQIAAGSLVLKPVAPHTMVAGSPAKAVGTVTGNPAEKMQQWSKKLNYDPFCDELESAVVSQKNTGSSTAASAKTKPGPIDVAASEAAWDEVAAKSSLTADMETAGVKDSHASTSRSSTSSGGSANIGSIRAPVAADAPVNGKHHPAATNGAGGSAAAPAAAGAASQADQQQHSSRSRHHGKQHTKHHAAAAGGNGTHALPHPQQQQQQQQWQPADAQHYVFEQVTGHHLEPPVESHLQQQQQQPGVQQQGQGQKPAAKPVGQEATSVRTKAGLEIKGVHGGEVEATVDELVAAEKWSDVAEDPEYVI